MATLTPTSRAGKSHATTRIGWRSEALQAAVRDTTQNLTPGGNGSALVEDKVAYAPDNTTELAYGYRVLQRAADSRIAVQAGKAYNVYFHVKAGNWVTTGNANGRMDTVHHEIVWRNAAGEVIDRIFSHPYWIYPQPFWSNCEVGHPEGKDDSITLARLTPPAGATTVDIRVGWLRNSSNPNPDDQVPRNPPGSLLYVDDLVVDAVGSAGAPPPTIALSRSGGQIHHHLHGNVGIQHGYHNRLGNGRGRVQPLPGHSYRCEAVLSVQAIAC